MKPIFKKFITTLANIARNILVFLPALIGLGAMAGGGLLIISPSGKLIGMPSPTGLSSHCLSFQAQKYWKSFRYFKKL